MIFFLLIFKTCIIFNWFLKVLVNHIIRFSVLEDFDSLYEFQFDNHAKEIFGEVVGLEI